MSNQTSNTYKYMSALFALGLWGSWAYYVNGGQDFGLRMQSAIAQGLASFVITLIMVRILSWISGFLPENQIRVVVPPILTVTLTGSTLFLIHKLVGTPRIIPTIAPALSVAFLFCVYTSFKLHNESLRSSN